MTKGLVCAAILAVTACGRPDERAPAPAADAGARATKEPPAAPRATPVATADDDDMGGGGGGISFEQHAALSNFDPFVAKMAGHDVVVARIEEIVSTHAPTNGAPPIVRLRVDEVLRGDPALDRSRAIWASVPLEHHPHPSPDEEEMKKQREAFDATRAVWLRRAVSPPPVGQTYVLVGRMTAAGFEVHGGQHAVATPHAITLARNAISYGDE